MKPPEAHNSRKKEAIADGTDQDNASGARGGKGATILNCSQEDKGVGVRRRKLTGNRCESCGVEA